MTPQATYRVVGVRADKSRMLICQKVTKQQAERAKESLEKEGAFQLIEIEAEDETTPELDLFTDE